MPSAPHELRCPHCAEPLKRFGVPDDTQWGEADQFVCFNDDCSYYQEGWAWMEEQYGSKTSYRYRVIDPETGVSAPLAVWSETAMRDRIIDDG